MFIFIIHEAVFRVAACHLESILSSISHRMLDQRTGLCGLRVFVPHVGQWIITEVTAIERSQSLHDVSDMLCSFT